MSFWYWLLWFVLTVGNVALFAFSFWNLSRTQELLRQIEARHFHCGDDECEEAHP